LETGQPIVLAARTEADAPPLRVESLDLDGKLLATTTLPAAARVRVETPLDPGFLQVRQGDAVLLDAGIHFADTREADFSACAPADTLGEGSAAAVERHTEEDHWWRVWFLLLLLALLISWHFTRERNAAGPQTPPQPPQAATP
jgi:hypothetical protein